MLIQAGTLLTRCSPSRFLCLYSRLDQGKQQVIRDMLFFFFFGQGERLMSITRKEMRHTLCLWLIHNFDVRLRKLQVSLVHKLEVTPTTINQLFGLSMHGSNLQV